MGTVLIRAYLTNKQISQIRQIFSNLSIFGTQVFPDASDFGCAVRSDGSLKDASEISWHYDVDDDLPIAPVGSTSSTPISPPNIHPFFTSHPAPAKMVAGSRRSARTLRPSARILDPNNTMNKPAPSSSTSYPSFPSVAKYKQKAPPSPDSPPSRHIAHKVNTDSSDEHDGDTSLAELELSSQPCESSDAEQLEHWPNKYEVLQSMADTDHRVCHVALCSEYCDLLTD